MNIEFLDAILSACFSLRKIKRMIINQEEPYPMRPQLHCMIISPFGTGKTSVTRTIENKNKDIFLIDDFTKPAIQGSIGKDGDIVPSILIHFGGKVAIIDEWNNIDIYGQNALLGLLENQQINRGLGFKAKTPYHFIDKNGYGEITVKENLISGNKQFDFLSTSLKGMFLYSF